MFRKLPSNSKTEKSNPKDVEKEKGFNIYLGGANAERVDTQLKREKLNRFSVGVQPGKERKNWNSNPLIRSEFPIEKAVKERKKWGEPKIDQNLVYEEGKIQEDENLVNCIESLDQDELNYLRNSMRLIKMDSSQKDKTGYSSDFNDDNEIIEEINKEKDDNEEEIIPEIIENNLKNTIKPIEKPIIVQNTKLQIIKARPISASLKVQPLKPINPAPIEKQPKKISNPFKNRPQTEISSRKIGIKTEKSNVNNEKSNKNIDVSFLLKKIQKLNDDKRGELEIFLEKLALSNEKNDFRNDKLPVEIPINPFLSEKFINSDIQFKSKEITKEKIPLNSKIIQLRVLSTWGNINIAGLTEIQLFNSSGIKINLFESNFQINNTTFPNNKNIKNLINGIYKTIDENYMWFAHMPAPPNCLEIIINIEKNEELGGIVIWNYNKSLIESVKGIKEIEILINNELKWNGIIKRGVANEFEDYEEIISFNEKLTNEIIKENIKKNEGSEEWRKPTASSISKPHPKIFNIFDSDINKSNPIIFKNEEKEKNKEDNKEDKMLGIFFTEDKKQKNNEKEKPIERFDEENSLLNLELFNLTQNGRLKPGDRERFLHEEAKNIQIDVQETVKNIYQKLDFNNQKEHDALDVFFQKEIQKMEGKFQNKPEFVQKEEFIPIVNKGKIIKEIFPKLEKPLKNVEKQENQKNIIISKSDDFFIPTLPKGKKISILISSTWGDKHYVGLTGMEFFDDHGFQINLKKSIIKAFPPDINVLPGYGHDPRTIDKIIDENNLTCDDLHMWLAPFDEGKENFISIELNEITRISMIRIWNYNKSRIHSFRGVKNIKINLDEKIIFVGEVKKANGTLQNCHEFAEYILFTKDENILKNIEYNDWLNKFVVKENINEDNNEIERPNTSSKKLKEIDQNQFPFEYDQIRPMTSVSRNLDVEKPKIIQKENIHNDKNKNYQYLIINLLDNWGDKYYVGLTGIELYDGLGKKIYLEENRLDAKPRDLRSVMGYEADKRILENLINSNNNTINEKNMWMIPFVKTEKPFISIQINNDIEINSIKIWNYNKSPDDINRGARLISIVLNDQYLTPKTGICIKKASGNEIYDFGQTIKLPYFDGWDEDKIKIMNLIKQPSSKNGSKYIQEYDTLFLPIGFTIKLVLLSTWGDQYYIGLNGIEIFDQNGKDLLKNKEIDYKFGAEPSSINCLKNTQGDVRTIDKLFNGINNTYNDNNIWLSPFIHSKNDLGKENLNFMNNTIFISFNKPIIISSLNIWNYSKTPSRGTKEIEIFLDENLIYKGYVKKAFEKSELKESGFNSILFSKYKDHVEKNKENIYTEDNLQQNVMFNNERNQLDGNIKEINKNIFGNFDMQRPMTCVKGN